MMKGNKLEGKIGGAYNKNFFDETPELKLPDEKAGHDCLPRSGIIGQEKANTCNLQEVIINGFKLVRQRIDAGDREAEVWIEFIGDTECISLKAKTEKTAVAIVGKARIQDADLLKVLCCEADLAEPFRFDPHESDSPYLITPSSHSFHAHGLVEERAD